MGVVFGKISEEMPRHAVVAQAANFAVRRYEASIAVQCDYGANGWGVSSDGSPFGNLARYIGVFSEAHNQQKQPIAMTAPVLIDAAKAERHMMMFLLPASKFKNIDEAPVPSNPNVRLQTLPERTQAVRTFSGNLRASRAKEQLTELLADIKADGRWAPSEPLSWQAAGYNAPFVLPWFKTNEVLVNVAEVGDGPEAKNEKM